MVHRAWAWGMKNTGARSNGHAGEPPDGGRGSPVKRESMEVETLRMGRGRWSRSYDLANSINGFMLPLSASCIAEIYIFRVSLCSVTGNLIVPM